MTMNATDLSKNLYELGCGLNDANRETQKRHAEIDRESDEMVAAIERAQARIVEMLRASGYDVEVRS